MDGFSANEAAVVTDVPLKQVHRMVDSGLIPAEGKRRVIDSKALVALRLAHVTADTLTPAARRRVVASAMERPDESEIRDAAVAISMLPIARDVAVGLADLEAAKAAVSSRRGIMGGAVCFNGTRIPVHFIADMLDDGDTEGDILAAYSSLTAEQLRLARVYARAYPRRGRVPFVRLADEVSDRRMPE